MNVSTSDSSSGCESGWTMYLTQSSYSQDHDISNHKNEDFIRYNKPRGNYSDGCDEQDEDLSMVSDASSGPPLFREDYEYCFDETKYIFYEEENKKVKNKGKEKKSGKKEYFYLNDTASSPINIKNHVAIHPRGTLMEHETHYKKQIVFFQSSISKKSDSGAAGGLQDKKMRMKTSY